MKVNWDDYPQYMEKNMFQSTNQMIYIYINPNKSQFSYGFPMV